MASSAPTLVAELDRKLACVLEPRMRLELVRECLQRLEPDPAYALLARALHRTPAPGAADPLADALHELLLEEVESDADRDRRAALYARAHAAGDGIIMALLRTRTAAQDLEDPASRLHVDLRKMPLGRRRSLARRPDPALLEQLARDPDPIVIRNLLQNPRTTEADVVRLAAARPVAASSLGEIQRSARWSRRSQVRSALARNPYAPVDVALQQLHALPAQVLREIESDPSLHVAVREHARHERERRGGR